jgi:hypothetical protein
MGTVLKMWLENEFRLTNLRAMGKQLFLGNACKYNVNRGADIKNKLFSSVQLHITPETGPFQGL